MLTFQELWQIHFANTMNVGFLAFQRLIGVVYFKKHCAAFDVDTPVAHFKCGQQGLTPEKHHSAWLENIRQTIWSRITYENETDPLYSCGYRFCKTDLFKNLVCTRYTTYLTILRVSSCSELFSVTDSQKREYRTLRLKQ